MIVMNTGVSFLLTVFVLHQTGVYGQGPVDDYCINCICQEGCAITYNYWTDAGRPTVRNGYSGLDEAYQSCYESYDCSAKAIQNYMFRFQRDCNNDGEINCMDHAAIHRHGAEGCANSGPDVFQFQVYNCLNRRK